MSRYHDQRMAQLMQLLPVILAQQDRQQQNALGYAQLAQTGQFHRGELDRQTQHDNAQDALARLGLTQQGEFHQGELAHQRAMEALGLRQADSQDAQQKALMAHQNALLQEQTQYHQGELGMHKADHEQALNTILANQTNEAAKLGLTASLEQQRLDRQGQLAMIESAGRFANATPESMAQMGAAFKIPGADTWLGGMQEDVANRQSAALQQAFGGVYSNWRKDPRTAQAGLNALWQDPKMQSPMIQDHMREWLRGQNEGLATTPTASGIDLSILSPADQQRYSGQLQQNQSDDTARQQAADAYMLKQKQAATIHALNLIQQQKANPYFGFAPVPQ